MLWNLIFVQLLFRRSPFCNFKCLYMWKFIFLMNFTSRHYFVITRDLWYGYSQSFNCPSKLDLIASMQVVNYVLILIEMRVIKPQYQVRLRIRYLWLVINLKPRSHSQIYLAIVLLRELHLILWVLIHLIEFCSFFLEIFYLFIKTIYP